MKTSYFWIALVIAVALSAGSYVLNKATNKENTQHITVEAGGTANIHNEIKEEKNSWFMPDSFNISTRTEDFKDIRIGLSWRF